MPMPSSTAAGCGASSTFWRVGALVILLLALGAGAAIFVPGGRLTPPGDYIARITRRGADPRQSRPRRGARAAVQVARPRRHRAHRQPRRHHRRLASSSTIPCAPCRPRSRWWWWWTGWPRPAPISPPFRPTASSRTHFAGRLDRRAVPVPQFHPGAQNARHRGRVDQILAAQGRALGLRADQPGGARRHRGDRARPYAWFKELVKDRRAMDDRQLAVISDGRVFTGRQSVRSSWWMRWAMKRPRSTGCRGKEGPGRPAGARLCAATAIQRAFLPASCRLELRGAGPFELRAPHRGLGRDSGGGAAKP